MPAEASSTRSSGSGSSGSSGSGLPTAPTHLLVRLPPPALALQVLLAQLNSPAPDGLQSAGSEKGASSGAHCGYYGILHCALRPPSRCQVVAGRILRDTALCSANPLWHSLAHGQGETDCDPAFFSPSSPSHDADAQTQAARICMARLGSGHVPPAGPPAPPRAPATRAGPPAPPTAAARAHARPPAAAASGPRPSEEGKAREGAGSSSRYVKGSADQA